MLRQQATLQFVICFNCMAYTSDHCTARCPKISCKFCKKIGHIRKDCPKLALKHKIHKEFTTATLEEDKDLDVRYGFILIKNNHF